MIRFRCACGRQLEAPDQSGGTTGRCPVCGTCATVPPPACAHPLAEAIQTDQARRREESVQDALPGQRPTRSSKGSMGVASSGKARVSLLLGVVSFCFLGNLCANCFSPAVMLWLASLLGLGCILAALPGLLLGGLSLSDCCRARTVGGLGTALGGMLLSLLALPVAFPVADRVQDRSSRLLAKANLEQLVLAMNNYPVGPALSTDHDLG
jgi:hypothetical protein